MGIADKRRGVSTTAYSVTVIILLIVAGIGYGLYVAQPRTTVVTSTTTVTSTTKARIGVVGGFLNGQIVAFEFYEPFQCTPTPAQLFAGDALAQAATAKTPCEVGAPGTFPANALPVWGLVPAFAGLSVFGAPPFGASPEGFPTYNGTTIITDCTSTGSAHPCPDHPPLFYSPVIVVVEKFMNITNGVVGLPEGVMPFPAHNHIVETDAGQQDIPWNAIAVFVFDPNIFASPITARCEQRVPSSLSNATANCLTSIPALQRAMATTNTAIAAANAKNPIWLALGKPLTQVVIAGATSPSQYRNANSNIDVPFAVKEYNPFPPFSP